AYCFRVSAATGVPGLTQGAGPPDLPFRAAACYAASVAEPLLIAKAGTAELCLLPAMGNRHGLVSGATGTGKTVTLQTIAHAFSARGVPVFVADVKGDVSGIGAAGMPSRKLED